MKKLAVGRTENANIALLFEGGVPAEFFAEHTAQPSSLFNIYRAKVENIRSNGIVFVRLSATARAILRADEDFKVGDLVTVMVEREHGCGKYPQVTQKYTLSTPSVIWTGDGQVHVSRRATPTAAARFNALAGQQNIAGVIFRSEAESFSDQRILEDIKTVCTRQSAIFEASRRGTQVAPILTLSFEERTMLQSGASSVEYVDFLAEPYAGILAAALQKRVNVPAVGNLVLEQTEAFVAIDVNSGAEFRYGSEEETAFYTNCKMVEPILAQVRLRNLSGTILIDAISMRELAHRDKLLQTFAAACKKDSVHCEVTTITPSGIVEMVRARRGYSLYQACGAAGAVVESEVENEILEP